MSDAGTDTSACDSSLVSSSSSSPKSGLLTFFSGVGLDVKENLTLVGFASGPLALLGALFPILGADGRRGKGGRGGRGIDGSLAEVSLSEASESERMITSLAGRVSSGISFDVSMSMRTGFTRLCSRDGCGIRLPPRPRKLLLPSPLGASSLRGPADCGS